MARYGSRSSGACGFVRTKTLEGVPGDRLLAPKSSARSAEHRVLVALRGPGESYCDVILRLAKA